jgi:hypothetical protein
VVPLMDGGLLATWVGDLIALIAIVISINTRVTARNTDKFDKIERDQKDLGDRVSRLETEVEHLPDVEFTHRLELSLTRLEGQILALDEKLKPVAAMAGRMQDVLLEGARK